MIASLACAVGAVLGEGPVWEPGADVLWFVDIKQDRVHRFAPYTQKLDSWQTPSAPGWIFPTKDGGYLCGLKTGLHRFDPLTGQFTLIASIEADVPGNRLNDATVDSLGRVWFGSMDNGETEPSGHFYRADVIGITRVLSGICITNGPALSPAGDLLYHTDTLTGVISVSKIADDGSLHDTRPFVEIAPADGYPDGPVVDAEGCLWTALWGGWSARRYATDGTLLQTVQFPAANITKLAFGGADRTTVYATSARKGLDAHALAAQPHAGDLFTFVAQVPGLPLYPAGQIGA